MGNVQIDGNKTWFVSALGALTGGGAMLPDTLASIPEPSPAFILLVMCLGFAALRSAMKKSEK